jgi:hypothetical protein
MIDVLELDLLSQLQAKRAAEDRVQRQQEWGLKHMASALAANGIAVSPTPTTTTSTASTPVNRIANPPIDFKAPDGIMNRSPITVNHYHNDSPPGPAVVVEPQPTPAPAPVPQPRSQFNPAWLLIPLVLALALLAGWLAWKYWPKPAAPIKPGGEDAQTTIILRDAP